ncbi:SGNH/GDSL hydrolase family protein [Arthrobacter bambusae]|uniref:SGNH/GDSL hydrolase family protein n=1 Tax=Arthrobacter bambusae TaxID=1338426 RepID=UPI002783A6CA|nr:SGNH/GDSL hydrolase family protein [Arthrobacter bambusae]MDQ0241155.1 lysophospholipase L1-like esterase [Arthrobacter bambusae]
MATRRHSIATKWKLISLGVLAVVALAIAGFAILRVPTSAPVSAQVASFTPSPQPTPTYLTMTGFLGDSYTAGDGGASKSERWTTLVAQKRNWVETNAGFGGTGYGTAGRLTGGAPYADRVPALVNAEAKLVIVSGGRNDLTEKTSAAQVAAGITKTFTDLRKGLPNARIIALSPLWDSTAAPSGLAAIGDEVKAAVEGVGGQYVDLGQPFAGRADLIGPDHVHPTVAGYAFLADQIDAALPKDLP